MSSLAGLCNPVAIQSYMNLPLKGDTNDYGTGANNPSNTSVTTTTGQFGESNGAHSWNSASDRLSWSNSVGDYIAGYINSNSCTVIFFVNLTDSDWSTGRIFSQWGNSGNRSFRLSYTALSIYNNFAATISSDGTNNTYNESSTQQISARGSWNAIALKYDGKQRIYFNGSEINDATPTDYTTPYNSSESFTLGNDLSSIVNGFLGSMHTFRIYESQLQDGELRMIDQQKGQII